jgi:hypothetical protein
MSEETVGTVENESTGPEKDGVEPEVKTYNQEELQSEVDRRISQAYESIKSKVQEDLKKEREQESKKQENERLITDRKYKELWEREQAEKDVALSRLASIERENQVAKMLKEENMMQFFDLLKDSEPDIARSKLESLKEITSSYVQETVESKLSHPTPMKSSNVKPSSVENMSDEEYIQWKKDKNIF